MVIIILLAAICNFVLGFLVYKSNHSSWLHRWFGIFGFITGFWVLSNFMTGIFPTLLWIKSVYALGALVPASAVMWILKLCGEKLKKVKVFFIWFLALIFFIVPYINDLLLTDVTKVYLGGVEGQYGPVFPFYTMYMLGVLFFASYKLAQGYRKAEGIQKLQLKFVSTGAILWVLVVSIVSFILPLFGIFQYTAIDSPTSFIFLLFTAYAITKHHLFNIKVIATELLAGLVSVVLLIELLLSKTVLIALLKAGILVAFVYLGVSLIKSVLKEIKNAEQIQKAYELEKHAHKELKRLDEAKTQFLMATQHHLRTPLTSMRGYVDLILGGLYGRVPQKLKEVILKFEKSTISEIKIVNELLDINQFQLGKEVVFLQPNIQIEPLLEEIIEELKFEAESEGIYLKLEKDEKPLPLIKADPSKLKVALSNIIDNAIKYTNKGGVTIKCQISNAPEGEQAPYGAGKLQIIVQDTGMGIAKEEQENLFTRLFERGAEAKKVFTTGRGIGLYLTAKIIEVHHGKVWAESEGKGKGSTFYVELPVG